MKPILLTALLITSSYLNAQNPEGLWSGFLEFGGKKMDIQIRLAFQQEKWYGTLSSQTQQLKGLILTNINLDGENLRFDVPLAGGSWKGQIQNDSLKGDWLQGGYQLPLWMGRDSQEIKVTINAREQTPSPPFPYDSKEVFYQNAEDQTQLAGTLTIPHGEGPFPAAILLSVAGPNDRDMSFGSPQHKPFFVLADFLSRNGIAVLRSDDRGIGKSGGSLYESTIHDFAMDAKAAFKYLEQESKIDPNQIGFIGNSEGTLVGPLATSYGCGTAFIITLGGIGIHGSEVIMDQIDAIGALSELEASELASMKEGTRNMFQALNGEGDREVIRQKLRKLLENNQSSEAKSLFLVPQSVEQQIEMFSSPWYRFQIRHDAGKVLQEITCPFLALHGSNDPFVNPDKNLNAISKNLALAGNTQYTLRKFKDVNHIFQDAQTGSPAAYQTNEITFSPRVLEFIKNWLRDILMD